MKKQTALSLICLVGLLTLTMGVSIANSRSIVEFIPVSEVTTNRPIDDFGLVSRGAGWVLTGQQLYWTNDDGANWKEITPPDMAGKEIMSVDFLDDQNGWLIRMVIPMGFPADFTNLEDIAYELGRTQDGGRSWSFQPLPLFKPGDPAALPGEVFLDFIDAQHGWLTIRQATGSNFRIGSLFQTSDGGQSWEERALPIGESASFIDSSVGFVAGGAAGDEFYRSTDGGKSWQSQTVQLEGIHAADMQFQAPDFVNPGQGILLVIASSQTSQNDLSSERATFQFYATQDKGKTWRLVSSLPGETSIPSGTQTPLAYIAPGSWIVILPGSGQTWRMSSSAAGAQASYSPHLLSQAPGLVGVNKLIMATAQQGWALSITGSCPSSASPENCRQFSQILTTYDGGHSWRAIRLPAQPKPTLTQGAPGYQPANPVAMGSRTLKIIGHGFDKCEIPDLKSLVDWKSNSPYLAVNLYYGGVSRACSNAALTADYLAELSKQGWTFIPTWVGPQSKCFNPSSTKPKIDDDTTKAYQQGKSEANLAIEAAAKLKLTEDNKTGTVIYYDLEGFAVTETKCLKSAQAFVNGWSEALAASGNLAGLYTLGPLMQQMSTIQHPPEVIWPANWVYKTYDPNATVWNVYGLDNKLWADHQRLRQYAGGHSETWGTTTLVIDSNVMDGVVADISCPESDDVILYRDPGYSCGGLPEGEGYQVQTVPGWQDVATGLRDAASSLRIPTGWSVALYELPGLQGGKTCMETSGDFTSDFLFDNGNPVQDNVASLWVFDTPGCASYSDTSPAHPAYTDVETLVQAGYTLECRSNPGGFCPDQGISHAEMAQLSVLARDGVDYEAPEPSPPAIFTDVPVNIDPAANSWYARWVTSMQRQGLAPGEACSSPELLPCFYPDQIHTRLQGARLFLQIQNGADYQPPPASGRFTDVNADDAPWVEQAVNLGIMQPCGDNLFCPSDPLMRSSAAHALVAMYGMRAPGGSLLNNSNSLLRYSTFFGGASIDKVNDVAYDSKSDLFITGYTKSTSLPFGSTPPKYGDRDAFVARLAPGASKPTYVTYLGGARIDEGLSIAIDPNGVAVVAGISDSTAFQSPNARGKLAGERDLFIAKIDPLGKVLWSAYLGGSLVDEVVDIALDQGGNILLTGRTCSSDFPTASPYQKDNGGGFDAFFTRLDPNGNLVYSTYLGGSGLDAGRSLSLDNLGGVFLAGDSGSNNFPVHNPSQASKTGGQDVFAALINASGNLAFSSYLGGKAGDWGKAVTSTDDGVLYLSGATASTDFPLASPIQASFSGGGFDAFITAIDVNSQKIAYSTFFGGTSGDFATGIDVTADGELAASGYSASTDFPLSHQWLPSLAGGSDSWRANFSPDGLTLLEGMLSGGTASEINQGFALRCCSPSMQGSGSVTVGITRSPALPATWPLQPDPGGNSDGFIFVWLTPGFVFLPLVLR